MEDGKQDLISSLISTPFKSRSENDKKIVLKTKRPTPDLNICVQNGHGDGPPSSSSLPFEKSWYVDYKWLVGCSINNRLYCWPCLLYSKNSNKKRVWTKDGFNDFKSFRVAADGHTSSKDHIQSVQLIGDHVNPSCVNGSKPPETGRLTENAKSNRLLLKRVIELATMLCKTEVALLILENESSDGTRFKEMFDLFVSHDTVLKRHCEKLGKRYGQMFSTLFKDVIETMSHEMLCFQRDELKKASFFSIQVDNSIDVGEEILHTIIGRYVDENGDVQEQFLGFPILLSSLCDHEIDSLVAANLFATLDSVLGQYPYKTKLVSQSYCGASVNPNELSHLVKKIKSKSPDALFLHSHSHQYKVVLQQGLNFIPETKIFFATMQSLIADFRKSDVGKSVIAVVLEESVASHTDEFHWSLNSDVIAFVLNERNNLMDAFNNRIDEIKTAKTMTLQANQFLRTLRSTEFVFLLLTFSSVFKLTDEFFGVLKKRPTDIMVCNASLKKCVDKLIKMSKDAKKPKDIYSRAINMTEGVASQEDMTCLSTILFPEIINNVIIQLEGRFPDYQHLEFLHLTDHTKFPSHKSTFPVNAFKCLEQKYPNHFNFSQLKEELEIFIYSDKQFYVPAPDVVKQIIEADLKLVVPQSYKLFSLSATFPLHRVRGESCFSRLNRYLDTNKKLGTFTARIPLCVLMVQEPLLRRLEKDDNWLDRIVDRFAKEKIKYTLELLPTKG